MQKIVFKIVQNGKQDNSNIDPKSLKFKKISQKFEYHQKIPTQNGTKLLKNGPKFK